MSEKKFAAALQDTDRFCGGVEQKQPRKNVLFRKGKLIRKPEKASLRDLYKTSLLNKTTSRDIQL